MRNDEKMMLTSITIIRTSVTRDVIQRVAKQTFGDFAKAVVDLGRNVMAIGGELHADCEEVLLADGSDQKNLWGINLYPAQEGDDWLQFDSMINIRPSQGNRSRNVEDAATQEKIRSVVTGLVV